VGSETVYGEAVHPNILILIATSLFYFTAAVLYLLALLGERDEVTRVASALTKVGLALSTVGLVALSIGSGHIPFDTMVESMTIVSWALVLIYLLIERQYRVTALGFFVNLLALVLTVISGMLAHGNSTGIPAMFQSHWSSIHILSCLFAYASFFLAFGAALVYILQEQMLRGKKINVLQRHLPSLDTADRLSYRLVALGFPMLTLGVVTGSIWAQSAWGSYWSWDPKETWAFATWLVYAAYLHVRIVAGRRGKWPNRLLVTGFCCIVFTFIGVNFLPVGLHRYYIK
jgi:cytochrome c-type biogenesis protein CcsB